MQKSVSSEEYRSFLEHFRHTRQGAGVTQVELARRVGQNQSFVSKCERGERRIDVIELRAFCQALEIDFGEFIATLDEKLNAQVRSSRKRRHQAK